MKDLWDLKDLQSVHASRDHRLAHLVAPRDQVVVHNLLSVHTFAIWRARRWALLGISQIPERLPRLIT